MSVVRGIALTLRPRQWVKNLFVAAPLVFAKRLDDERSVIVAGLAMAAFCALSSAVYALNDVLDREKDLAHPVKRKRPIASGVVSPALGVMMAAMLAIGGLAGAFALAPSFGMVAGGYLILNLAYSLRLKEIAFIDVGSIAGGFLLRVLGGAFAIGVPPSRWLMACTVLLAAFLGFGKRSHELNQASARDSKLPVGATRKVLSRYRAHHLALALRVLGIATCLAYIVYTQWPHTVDFFGTRQLIWTAPFCVFGIARFLRIVTRRGPGDSPTEEMLRDMPFMANLALWGAAVMAIIYLL
jgi:decaprenyl-phosphate phosphoribosyltransferase